MIDSARQKKQTNRLSTILLAYILSYPIFEDMGISWSLRHMLFFGLVFLEILLTIRQRSTVKAVAIDLNFVFCAAVVFLSFVFSDSRKDVEIISYMLVLLFCVVVVLTAATGIEQVVIQYRITCVVAVVLSAYIVMMHFFPTVYTNIVLPRLPEAIRSYNNWILGYGYGVSVGGSIVYADYVISLAGISSFTAFLYGTEGRHKLGLFLLPVFLIAMYYEGRRGELLCFMVALLVVLIYSIFISLPRAGSRSLLLAMIGFAVVVIAIVFFLRMGGDSRIASTIQSVLGQESEGDISSGRFERWALAIDLFREKPLMGIGWGQYAYRFMGDSDTNLVETLINYKYAHNDYLNVLCEMGVIGFFLFYVPLTLTFLSNLSQGWNISRGTDRGRLILTVNSFCVGFHTFWATLGLLDPVLYKQQFLSYYALLLICYKTVLVENEKEDPLIAIIEH